jgi:hypothetical protein
MMRKLTDARMVLEHWHFQLKHKQCHNDGEDTIAKCFDARQAQLTAAEATKQKTHCNLAQ